MTPHSHLDGSPPEILRRSGRPPLEEYRLGITRWHSSLVSNGLLEGLNSLIQAAKRRARGYRTNRNYIAMIYLVAGKLSPGRRLAHSTP